MTDAMGEVKREVERGVTALLRAVSIFAALLFLVTWPLWGGGAADAVQIPWLRGLCGVPGWVDLFALVAVGCGLVGMAWGRGSLRFVRGSLGFFTVGLLMLVALDQHRFQPWVCEFLLFGVLFLIAPNALGVSCWKVVIGSIYLWSAISKLDSAFLTAHGQLLLEGFFRPLGVDLQFWSETTKKTLAACFPWGELGVGLLLLIPRTRKYGFPLSIVMHLLLLWILGVGLKHEWGVLTWNLFFIVQNCILFGSDLFKRSGPVQAASVPEVSVPEVSRTAKSLAILWTAIAAMYPGLELMGLCDHWPAWAVYSPRPAQVKVLIREIDADSLPESLKRYLGQPAPLEDRIPMSLDSWSFQEYGCPIYPQLRYRLACALALLEGRIPDDSLTVEIGLTPDRWTGQREKVTLRGLKEVKDWTERFWWNTQPRGR